MNKLLEKFLTDIPYTILVPMALLMLLAPFQPMPHLVEKFIMLKNGELKKAIDIFDVFFHLAPSFLLLLKAYFQIKP